MKTPKAGIFRRFFPCSGFVCSGMGPKPGRDQTLLGPERLITWRAKAAIGDQELTPQSVGSAELANGQSLHHLKRQSRHSADAGSDFASGG